MAKFLLIDHSLKGVGGHHFEYAAHLLAAARRAGYEAIVATHRRFTPGAAHASHAAVYPVFRYTTYSKFTVYRSRAKAEPHSNRNSANLRCAPAGDSPTAATSLWQRLGDWLHDRGRRRRVDAFTSGLHRLFREIVLSPGDQVFIPTLSELDLAGLVPFLREHEASRAADWHLQFHYAIFDGRESDYPRQAARLAHMRDAFSAALAQAPNHRLHYYNTTEQLTDQYNRMGVAPFHTLPYPVNDALREAGAPVTRNSSKPLRVTSLGAIRAEKGAGELAALVARLWPSHFRNGRCQLVVQSNKKQFRLPLPEAVESLPVVGGQPCEPVVYAPHPLAMDAYVDMIRAADIGLLLYDSERYYVRCSGVLVELLTVGIPVIASAGCWMAEQLAEAIFAHADVASRELDHVAAAEFPRIVATTATPHAIEAPIGATHALVSFDRELAAGQYVNVGLRSPGENGASITSIVGNRKSGTVRALFPLGALSGATVGNASLMANHSAKGFASYSVAPSAKGYASQSEPMELALSNAYAANEIALRNVRVEFLSAAHRPNGSYPLGAVGLLAADPSQVPLLLADIIEHWPHYRRTALEFAKSWSQCHHAGRIVAELAHHAARDRRQAAA
jgi:hypothetical protein